ncbi:MAG: hypothetical protein O2816_02270 [Planctomycetota bacterium]|nr:hypothetical protein [Planctomycetota bacterium]
MQAAHERHGDRIAIVGVVSGPDSSVDEAKLVSLIGKLGLTYPQVRDRELTLTHAFDVDATPTIVVLDASGRLIERGHELPDFDAVLAEL